MFELCACADPKMLETFLYPSLTGSSYLGLALRVAMVYFVPFAIAFLAGWLIVRFRRRRYRPAIGMILIALAPPTLWLLLIYSDMSGKGSGNLIELPLLGIMAGLFVGLDGRLVRPFLNGVTSAWLLAVVALSVYLYMPYQVFG